MQYVGSIRVTGHMVVFVLLTLIIQLMFDLSWDMYYKHFKRKVLCSSLPGHLRPIGYGVKVDPLADIITQWPSEPFLFWSKYVFLGLPALCKDCLKIKKDWNHLTDQYLREQYGDSEANVETKKKENRQIPSQLMTLNAFLENYKKDDLYLVDSIPSSALDEIELPDCLRCDLFRRFMIDSILWLSDGGTASVLHTDSVDNIICVLDGTKDFLLADKTFGELVLDVPDEGYSSVDVNAVDLCRYPGVKSVVWSRIRVEAGSCLFVPYLWLHQVRSLEGRNLAVSFLFHHLDEMDPVDCSLTPGLRTLYDVFAQQEASTTPNLSWS